jgi:hypothetical protein
LSGVHAYYATRSHASAIEQWLPIVATRARQTVTRLPRAHVRAAGLCQRFMRRNY